jgi:hypothetical protein
MHFLYRKKIFQASNLAFENNFVVDVKLLIALDYTISDYLKIETHIIILHTKGHCFFPHVIFFQELAPNFFNNIYIQFFLNTSNKKY